MQLAIELQAVVEDGKPMKYRKQIKLNSSIKSRWSIILLLLSHILYGYLFMEVFYKIENYGPGFDILISFFFLAIMVFMASLINLQQLFITTADEDEIEMFKGNMPDTYRFYNSSFKNGFQKPLAYLLPAIFYISGFSLTCYVFVTLIREGIAGFNYDNGVLAAALVTWIIVIIPGVKLLLKRYAKLSGFVGIYYLGLIFRQGINIYYVPYSSLRSIIKIVPVKKVSHLQFEIKPAGSVQLWLEPFHKNAIEIVSLVENYAGISGKITGIKINKKPLFRFNRPTTMTRSSRWR